MIAIVDYDAGNLKSVEKALIYIGENPVVTSDADTILNADKVILPGVGAFGDAMEKQEDLLMYSRRLPQRAHLYLEYVWECSFYLIVVKKLQVMLVVFQFFRERFVISQRTQI